MLLFDPHVDPYNPVIVLSRVARSFELKPHHTSLLPSFNGLPNENPLDFIREFFSVATNISAPGLTSEDMVCFLSSLKDKAKAWLLSLPPRSLHTWEIVFKKLVNHYFSHATTSNLRKQIATFEYFDGESFHVTWERFKGLERDCPHHNYLPDSLMTIFFDRLPQAYRNQIELRAGGDFEDLTPEEGRELLEKLSEKSRQKNMRGRKVRVNEVSTKESDLRFTELQKEVENLKSTMTNAPVKCQLCGGDDHVAGVCSEFLKQVGPSNADQEVNAVQGFNSFGNKQPFGGPKPPNQAYHPSNRDHPLLKYGPESPNFVPAPKQVDPRYLAPPPPNRGNFQGVNPNVVQDWQQPVANLSSRMDNMEKTLQHLVTEVGKLSVEKNKLPSQSEQAMAVHVLRSGKKVDNKIVNPSEEIEPQLEENVDNKIVKTTKSSRFRYSPRKTI
ncbi:hypothetical protein CASFOL_017353 [Castilleja foliolosa]|uniref:Retrotransposon gag domain-containing protein n=1 Tax=Castilleja foliolosa TaxID=1961234 RepID=A0ABD3DEU2_9LAMI